MSLEGRVALVTGGGRGIGAAISRALAEDGADVAVNYHRDRESADETVAAIEGMGRKALAIQAGIDVLDEVNAMAAAAIEAFGHVDILVHNAGIASRGNSVAKTEPDELDRVMRTHALGPHWLSRAIIPSMRTQPRGDIVFISSVATRNVTPSGAPYNMGKAAAEALALTLSKELRHQGVRVNIVAPGVVETEMGRRLVKATAGIEDITTMYDMSPFGRVCQPDDVANVVRWLVSDGASYLTGERLYLDGQGMA